MNDNDGWHLDAETCIGVANIFFIISFIAFAIALLL